MPGNRKPYGGGLLPPHQMHARDKRLNHGPALRNIFRHREHLLRGDLPFSTKKTICRLPRRCAPTLYASSRKNGSYAFQLVIVPGSARAQHLAVGVYYQLETFGHLPCAAWTPARSRMNCRMPRRCAPTLYASSRKDGLSSSRASFAWRSASHCLNGDHVVKSLSWSGDHERTRPSGDLRSDPVRGQEAGMIKVTLIHRKRPSFPQGKAKRHLIHRQGFGQVTGEVGVVTAGNGHVV